MPLDYVHDLNVELYTYYPIPKHVKRKRPGDDFGYGYDFSDESSTRKSVAKFSLKDRNWVYRKGHHKPAPQKLIDLVEFEMHAKAERMIDAAVLGEWAWEQDWGLEDRKQKTAGLKRRLRLEGWTEDE